MQDGSARAKELTAVPVGTGETGVLQNLEKTFLFSQFLDLRSSWLRVITAQMQTAYPLLIQFKSTFVATQLIFCFSSVNDHALSRSHIGKGFDLREAVQKGLSPLLHFSASCHALGSRDLFAQRISRAFNTLRNANPAPFCTT
jgi:hypothetical protein